jgi:hypothetical protein
MSNLAGILQQLQEERDRLDQAIAALESMADVSVARQPGRPAGRRVMSLGPEDALQLHKEKDGGSLGERLEVNPFRRLAGGGEVVSHANTWPTFVPPPRRDGPKCGSPSAR